ncbi:dienelactone hydrolase [Xylariaceae sp. FL0255]|nr:dienelactone hydrolase [Xylariaceae sp. FL0255]
MSKYSEACCSLPAVVAEGYVSKGKFVDLDGTRAYVTGPADATKAIMVAYDIFGYFPQTLQGADIFGQAGYQVFIPDFFGGNFANIEWFPPDNPEKGEALQSWFKIAMWPIHRPKIPGILKSAEKVNTNIKDWGIIGYCWGGKMASMVASDEPGLFKVAIQTSPAQLDPADGAAVKIPMMLLSSKDESDADTKKYDESLTVPKYCTRFDDQVHGFMSARADLGDAKVKAAYEKGYQMSLAFFKDHL